MELTISQQEVIKLTLSDKKLTFIGGYAGTGKTTIISHLIQDGREWKVATPTGKAASVLNAKGVPAQTIHSLLYEAIVDGEGNLIGFEKKKHVKAPYLIIDEASMVGSMILDDLMNTKGIGQIIFFGDPFQLPPVQEEQFFNNDKLDVVLTEVHRQAQDSQILRVATDIRKTGKVNLNFRNAPLQEALKKSFDKDNYDATILTWTNETRNAINKMIVGERGPESGDIIVAMKTNHRIGFINGNLYTISWMHQQTPKEKELGYISARILDLSDPYSDPMEIKLDLKTKSYKDRLKLFNYDKELYNKKLYNLVAWDYGYALTVHKSQGSQWNEIYLVPEYPKYKQEAARWYYTAITRAKNEVYLTSI